jgi:hypothetical protein
MAGVEEHYDTAAPTGFEPAGKNLVRRVSMPARNPLARSEP